MTFTDDTGATSPPAGDRFLEWKTVKGMTGFSRTTAWRRQKAGDFPPPRQISPGRVGWLASEISAWQASRAPRGEVELPAFKPLKARKPSQPQPQLQPPSRPSAQQALTQPAGSFARPPRPRVKRTRADESQAAFDF